MAKTQNGLLNTVASGLKITIKIGVFFILFLPLIMSSQFFFPFIVLKNVLFLVAVEIIFASYLILCSFDRSYWPKFNALTIGVLALGGISLLAGLLGIDFNYSFWGNYERMGGLFHLLHLVLYFLVLTNTFKESKDWHSFITFSIFVSLLMSFLGLAQWLKVPFLLKSSGGDRLTGTIGNAIYLAAYLIFNLFFTFYFLLKTERFNLRLLAASFLGFDIFLILGSILNKIFSLADWGFLDFLKLPLLSELLDTAQNFTAAKILFYFFLFFQLLILLVWLFREKKYYLTQLLLVLSLGLQFFIFINTQTRGAFFGLYVSLMFLGLVFLFCRFDKKFKFIVGAVLIISVLTPVVLFSTKNSAFVKSHKILNRVAAISWHDITTESRLLTWQASWRGWTENAKTFLIGYGPENYYYVFNKYFPVEIYRDHGSQIWFDRPHNIIFDAAVTTGLAGLVIYLGVLIYAGKILIKNYQHQKELSSSWLLVALLIAYFLQNFFVFDTVNTEILFYLVLAWSVFISRQNSEVDSEPEPARPTAENFINYFYISAALVAVLVVIWGINLKILKANHNAYQALTMAVANGEKMPLDYFKEAIDGAILGKFEVREQLANYVLGILSSNDNLSSGPVKAIVNYANGELEKSLSEQPLNVRNYLTLASFYDATVVIDYSNPGKVIKIMSEAIELSPTRPQLYYELAQAYTFLGQFPETEKYFLKGLNLAPWVLEDNRSLLLIYASFGQQDKIVRQLALMKDKFNWQPSINDYIRLTEILAQTKNYTSAIEWQKKVLALNPVAENYLALAELYAKIGQNQLAEAVINQAVAADKNFSTNAKEFLTKLKTGQLLDKTQ